MLLIAHRGNLFGPNPSTENKPETIEKCISLGYSVEIDLRVINGELFLGHDNPDYKIDLDFLKKHKDFLWIHCKNLEAILFLINTKINFTFFSHDKDPYVICSNGKVWAYPLKEVKENCVCVMPEWADKYGKNERWKECLKSYAGNCYGICSDYVFEIKFILEM